MPHDFIRVRGAREHNLKSVDLEIPRDRLVVITGLSGSGKSSLAFDTIYAEGQRRYVESLSAYARQFLGQMDKPDVDYIEGLSPAISIDQKGVSHNPRSTVGTVTEIYDHMRLLFARVGTPHCPRCGREISQQTVQQIVDKIRQLPEGTRIMVLAPIISDRKGEHERVFEDARRAGYVRVRVDGEIRDLSEEIALKKNLKHTIEIVVDRLIVRAGDSADGPNNRLAESVESALKLGGGVLKVQVLEGEEFLFSEHFACVYCGVSIGEIEPRTFSFNNPHGACSSCSGLGTALEIDPDLIIPDRSLSIAEGAIQPLARPSNANSYYMRLIQGVVRRYGFSMTVPLSELSDHQISVLLYGSRGEKVTIEHTDRAGNRRTVETSYEGIIPNMERRHKESESDYARSEIERYMSSRPCAACRGARLRPESLAVKIGGRSIIDVTRLSVRSALAWFDEIAGHFSERQSTIARQILKEITARLGFLLDVGLDYLTLDRQSSTLSGGESQRIRLATQIGSSLMGVLYILDEPSIGLHQRDNHRLIETLIRLRDLGNTVLVVEHDEDTMRAADWLIDMGPAAGEHGGQVVNEGSLKEFLAKDSPTSRYLTGKDEIAVPTTRREPRQPLPIRAANGARSLALKTRR